MKKFTWFINIIVCFALAYSFIQINDLQNQVNNLRNSINNIDRHLSNDMSNIYQNVQNMLDEESNQLTISEWKYGNIDVSKRTAEIECSVVPKEYNPNSTKVKLLTDNEEYLMDYANGKYVLTMEVPLFETTQINQVILDDNGSLRTQKLDWSINPRYESLIYAYASSSGSSRGTYGDKEYIWNPNFKLTFDIEKNGTFNIKQIELVESIDGKEISRTKVDISYEGQKAYAEQLASKGEIIPENLNPESNNYEGHVSFIYPYKKEIKITNGSTFILYADIVDENDLIHRCFVDCIILKDNGELDEDRMEEYRVYSYGEATMILDEKGNILYKIDTDLFK